jgi:hypothetical protein
VIRLVAALVSRGQGSRAYLQCEADDGRSESVWHSCADPQASHADQGAVAKHLCDVCSFSGQPQGDLQIPILIPRPHVSLPPAKLASSAKSLSLQKQANTVGSMLKFVQRWSRIFSSPLVLEPHSEGAFCKVKGHSFLSRRAALGAGLNFLIIMRLPELWRSQSKPARKL